MFFIKYNPDQFDTIQQLVHPFNLNILSDGGGNPKIALNYTHTIPAGDRTGIFNGHNLSWVALEKDESFILDVLSDQSDLDTLYRFVPEDARASLHNMLLVLYARGLLAIDDKPYVNNQVFHNGVMYHHSYLIELLLTERCNLRCTYCFAEVDNRKKLMGEDMAEKILKKVLELPVDRLMVEFSGGEVFLNYDTFKYSINYLNANKGEKTIQFSAQTNAILLTEEIISFCKDNQVHLSLTLDGPERIHNAQRIDWGGKGSYRKVLQSIALLQKHNVPFGVIGVVTRHSIGAAEEMMEHYSSLGISSVKLNHCTPQGYSKEVWNDIGIDGSAYLSFIKQVYSWILSNKAKTREFNIESYFLNILSRTSQYRCTRTTCKAGSEFLVFDPEGGIFPCPRYKHNPETRLGNINDITGSVDQLYKKNALIEGIDNRNVNTISLCKTCMWKNACRGGCSLETYEAFHTLDRESGICSFFKGIYPFLFKQLIENPEFITCHLLNNTSLIGASLTEYEYSS